MDHHRHQALRVAGCADVGTRFSAIRMAASYRPATAVRTLCISHVIQACAQHRKTDEVVGSEDVPPAFTIVCACHADEEDVPHTKPKAKPTKENGRKKGSLAAGKAKGSTGPKATAACGVAGKAKGGAAPKKATAARAGRKAGRPAQAAV